MKLAFYETASFSKIRDRFFGSDDPFRLFQDALLDTPRLGVVIPGSGGIRKIRWPDPRRGKGKRGGLRILYYYIEDAAVILLMAVYDKNVEDLDADQKKALAQEAEEFRRDQEQQRGSR